MGDRIMDLSELWREMLFPEIVRRRADHLEEQIERTDAVIDAIVYELYGLDEDECELVKESAGD